MSDAKDQPPSRVQDRTLATLEAAVGKAVSESLDVISGLQARVQYALSAIESVADRARVGLGQDSGGLDIIDAFSQRVR